MPAAGRRRFETFPLLLIVALMLAQTPFSPAAFAAPRATEFKLDNGLQVVVIEDRRAPVVTHMVWYRVGAADEPKGKSGIAHFLEHLMFKSTEKIAIGEFSKIVARLGGQDNAFTSQDATAYFQRIAKERLADVMAMEADRMVNLRLTEKEVLTERDVILEERRSRIENNPSSILTEQMDAALYYHHPYGIPVIGWAHEIAALGPDDALSFYRQHYAPNNAILVVSGDVSSQEVRRLAETTYGKIPTGNGIVATRVRPQDPEHRVARRLELVDPRAGNASITRYYFAPSYLNAPKGKGEALEVLMKVVASGSTSRLYKRLVVDKKVASNAGGWYSGEGIDSGKLSVYAVAQNGTPLADVEREIDAVLADVKANGITEAELKRAKTGLAAEYIYESDSQSTLARRYGWGLVVGHTVAAIEEWPQEVAKVTAEDVKAAAAEFLDARRSVTGWLVPEKTAAAAATAAPAPAPAPASPPAAAPAAPSRG
ncbi:MAG: pitrilysin family protein [Hyphomicrobiaceae bacterium]|nr:pitrilysin family protein [Hyphomicrobiaceae bacterium]